MKIQEYIYNNQKINNITDKIINASNYNNIYIGNVSDNYSKMLAANYFLKSNKTVIYLTSNIYHAQRAYDTFLDYLGKEKVSFFPGEEFVSQEMVASSNTFKLARMNTLARIIKKEPGVIVINTEGALKNVMSFENIKKSIINIKPGDIYIKDNLIKELVIRGYKKQIVTESQGTFSVRGEVLDIFPVNEDDPIRINFFDDEVETIKYFDVSTQLSIKKIDNIEIYPVYEMYYEDVNSIKDAIYNTQNITDKIKEDIERLENYENLDQLYIYLPYIDPNYKNILDLIDDKSIFIDEYNEVLDKQELEFFEISNYLETTNYKINNNFFNNITDILANNKNIFLNRYLSNIVGYKFDEFIDTKTANNIEYNNNIRNLLNDLKANPDKTYLLTHEDERKLKFIEEVLLTNNIKYTKIEEINKLKPKSIYITVLEDAHGYNDLEENFELITPYEYASGKVDKKTKYQSYYKNSIKIYNKDELVPGDYVVHQTYGIGKYIGIETVERNNIKNDYLVLAYAEDSKLKIPVENIYILEKYLGNKERIPKLNNINSKDWAKKKARIQEKVVELASRLIKVQAERELKKGFVYPIDSEEQLMFEKDFGYLETPDQIKAIKEVKEDLMSGKLMDRLLCGDVGFGKTEVAMRAAFKVVEGGKQVAYLAPTTVLTRQHYLSFKDRFEEYGVKVELLNRFVPLERQKEIIRGIKTGYVDIVIGTHRLLSKEIVFKDLGMLIIDEEQRFGVEHKERFKELKTDVDVLSLSATPIPRTLQMSLLGVKDLSVIETPPVNRLPIQTYLLENNDSVIREAINRELGRKGQVFYLLNRITELDKIVKKVKKLVPKARIGVIHGRLDRDDIEIVINDFVEGNLDVLICTTIIETGIDIPNANTLIIERAELLGLSQLYQIRGRVGRSDRVAYAYFMYEKNKILTETSKKRLEAIREFTTLGSGYKIAMRDLSIRGAGDILGKEQSGFIDDIGITLYIKMLNDEVARQKGINKEEEKSANYRVEVSHHIDALYVGDDALRIEMHKTINKVKSRDQQQILLQEFADRYGTVKEEIKLYIEAKYLEHLLKTKGIESFKETPEMVKFNFSEEKTQNMSAKELYHLVSSLAPKFKLDYINRKVHMTIKRADFKNSYIYSLTKVLENVK